MTTAAAQPAFLTVSETAEWLRLSESTTRRLIAAKVLPAYRVGAQLRIPADELSQWLAAQALAVGTDSLAGEPALGPGSSGDALAERDGTSSRREAVEPAQLAGEER